MDFDPSVLIRILLVFSFLILPVILRIMNKKRVEGGREPQPGGQSNPDQTMAEWLESVRTPQPKPSPPPARAPRPRPVQPPPVAREAPPLAPRHEGGRPARAIEGGRPAPAIEGGRPAPAIEGERPHTHRRQREVADVLVDDTVFRAAVASRAEAGGSSVARLEVAPAMERRKKGSARARGLKRHWLSDRSKLRSAILIQEVLGAPVGMRRP